MLANANAGTPQSENNFKTNTLRFKILIMHLFKNIILLIINISLAIRKEILIWG